jgi:hypothetical protein
MLLYGSVLFVRIIFDNFHLKHENLVYVSDIPIEIHLSS